MQFLKANAKGLLVGLSVTAVWASADWFAARYGLPFGRDRNYWDTIWAATAGAAGVFVWQT